jgi:hypothetical protein
MKDPALKGIRDGNCNRTACQAPGATGWHSGTRAWYCSACTRDINHLNSADAMRLYGVPFLIVVPSELSAEDRAKLESHGQYIHEA